MTDIMRVVDGRRVDSPLKRSCDVAIIGSGPAGATVARRLARQGVDVVIIEEGPWMHPDEFPDDQFTALGAMWRDMAASLTSSWPPIPVLQGVAVGGSTVINGAICWRLPEYVHEQWCEEDPPLREALPWEQIEADFERIEEELSIGPTDWEDAGRNNQLFAEGAEQLGLEHKPTDLNIDGACTHGNRGCPGGNKMSMDRTYLPQACKAGAEILSCTTAEWIIREDGRAVAVEGRTKAGAPVRVDADHAVVLAASAIQSPAILQRNGIDHGPVGENLQAHPGSSVMGLFDEKVEMWRGATQGHEMIGMRDEGIKMETLGYNPTLLTMRMKAIGKDLAREIARLDHWANGGAAVRSDATGTVRPTAGGGTKVSFTLTEHDLRRLRKGVAEFGRIMLTAGAREVTLGPPGWQEVTSMDEIEEFRQNGPTDAKGYEMILSHMFGTCQMGSDPSTSVVGPDFQHHAVEDLYVADSSVFPTNTGVNPQVSIIALAMQCARRILER